MADVECEIDGKKRTRFVTKCSDYGYFKGCGAPIVWRYFKSDPDYDKAAQMKLNYPDLTPHKCKPKSEAHPSLESVEPPEAAPRPVSKYPNTTKTPTGGANAGTSTHTLDDVVGAIEALNENLRQFEKNNSSYLADIKILLKNLEN